MSLKPRIYKKVLYIGEKKVIKLTKQGIRQAATKVLLVFITAVMLLTMIFGGFALLFSQEQSVTYPGLTTPR
jgi:hypothetical protein